MKEITSNKAHANVNTSPEEGTYIDASEPYFEDYNALIEKEDRSFSEELRELEELHEERSERDQKIEAEADLRELFKDLNRQVYAQNPLGLPVQTSLSDSIEESRRNTRLSEMNNLDFERLGTNDGLDPIINLDREKLKMTVEFPMLETLKQVDVQYDPATRSVIAEMITSQEAARILQRQVSDLESSLSKHNIRLQSLRITPSGAGQDSGSSSQHRQPGNRAFEYA
ncbi:MAG: hypothetical protein SFT81_07370 [Candidatus Caenarcaniphilales bacterium]|nr:hypothetical protein [Candidatus Caenarcaniphilales bacterium]